MKNIQNYNNKGNKKWKNSKMLNSIYIYIYNVSKVPLLDDIYQYSLILLHSVIIQLYLTFLIKAITC